MSKKRTLKGDIKTVADKLSSAGKRTAEFLGLVDARPEGAPQPNEHGPEVESRTEHFTAGMSNGPSVTMHVPEEHTERDKHFEKHGLGIGSEGNVTSIRRGIALKGERAARRPEGY
jgi:hypothetical protein